MNGSQSKVLSRMTVLKYHLPLSLLLLFFLLFLFFFLPFDVSVDHVLSTPPHPPPPHQEKVPHDLSSRKWSSHHHQHIQQHRAPSGDRRRGWRRSTFPPVPLSTFAPHPDPDPDTHTRLQAEQRSCPQQPCTRSCCFSPQSWLSLSHQPRQTVSLRSRHPHSLRAELAASHSRPRVPPLSPGETPPTAPVFTSLWRVPPFFGHGRKQLDVSLPRWTVVVSLPFFIRSFHNHYPIPFEQLDSFVSTLDSGSQVVRTS